MALYRGFFHSPPAVRTQSVKERGIGQLQQMLACYRPWILVIDHLEASKSVELFVVQRQEFPLR